MCAGLPSTVSNPSSLHGFISTVDLAFTTNGAPSTTARVGKHSVFLKPRHRVKLQYCNMKSTMSALKQNSSPKRRRNDIQRTNQRARSHVTAYDRIMPSSYLTADRNQLSLHPNILRITVLK